MRLYHATHRAGWAPHAGACFASRGADAISSATVHGGRRILLVEVDLDLADLVVEDRTALVERDDNSYPGDTARSLRELAADGLDVVTYDDETEGGRGFVCYRLVSSEAIARCTVVSVTEVD